LRVLGKSNVSVDFVWTAAERIISKCFVFILNRLSRSIHPPDGLVYRCVGVHAWRPRATVFTGHDGFADDANATSQQFFCPTSRAETKPFLHGGGPAHCSVARNRLRAIAYCMEIDPISRGPTDFRSPVPANRRAHDHTRIISRPWTAQTVVHATRGGQNVKKRLAFVYLFTKT